MSISKFQKNLIGHAMAFLAILAVYIFSKQTGNAHLIKFHVFGVYIFGHLTESMQRAYNSYFFKETNHGTYFFRVGCYTVMISVFAILSMKLGL